MGQAIKTKDKVKDGFLGGEKEPILCWNVREKQRKGKERVSKAFFDDPRSFVYQIRRAKNQSSST